MTHSPPDYSHPESNTKNSIQDLVPLIYDALRRVAHQKMLSEKPGQTLQTTALVHEAYVRLVHNRSTEWNGPEHFFSAAAEAMRRILVERARRRHRLKHGAGLARVSIEDAIIESPVGLDVSEVLSLDAALKQLEKLDERKARVVKLRYFTGLTITETAEALGVCEATVKTDWVFARAWLQKRISEDQRD